MMWAVTVMIVDKYWSVEVLVEGPPTSAKAIDWVQNQFDEAVKLGYATGKFRATSARLIGTPNNKGEEL